MVKQQIIFYIYLFSFCAAYAADGTQNSQTKHSPKKLTQNRVIDGVLARTGTMPMGKIENHIHAKYVSDQTSNSSVKQKSGIERVLWSPTISETTPEETKKQIEDIRSKQAFIVFAILPSDMQKKS